MLEISVGLRAFDAIADLETRVVGDDGGRLKLEWGVLHARDPHEANDLLWFDGDELVGYLGLYAFGAPGVELAGMVDPRRRREGIGSALLAAALPLCIARGYRQALLVTPRTSGAGAAFAAARSASFDHSEYALALRERPADTPEDRRLSVRTAAPTDIIALTEILSSAFDWVPELTPEGLVTDRERTLVIELDDIPVGTMRLNRDGTDAGIYGFAVTPGLQGRGIGRDALGRVCRELWADSVLSIGLETAVGNDNALRLYTSLGFVPVITEDYFAIPLD